MSSAAPKPLKLLTRPIEALGSFVLLLLSRVREGLEGLGRFTLLALQVVVWAVRPPYRLHNLFAAMEFVGVGSLFIIVLTGFFSGAVFALQSAAAFRMFNAEAMVGSTVALSLTREIGPVFTALMVAGRVGSGMATELGTMRVTEQIDALVTMAVNPIQYLIVPRVLAALIMVPILTVIYNLVGMGGSYLVAVGLLEIDAGQFVGNIQWYVDPVDLNNGEIKAAVFGVIVALVGCYKGFHASGGAKGVGEATTQAVVISSVSVLISDYFLTALMW